MKSCKSLKGGLNDLAEDLQVGTAFVVFFFCFCFGFSILFNANWDRWYE
jgi:hypothetical protein